jgi:hypothetical protein
VLCGIAGDVAAITSPCRAHDTKAMLFYASGPFNRARHFIMHLNHRLRLACMRAALAVVAACSGAVVWGASAIAQSATPPATAAPSAEPAWRSSPFHGVIGGDGRVIPCRCLYRGRAYQLGEKVCMQTYRGTVMTECDLQQNNTSWVPTDEVCTTS